MAMRPLLCLLALTAVLLPIPVQTQGPGAPAPSVAELQRQLDVYRRLFSDFAGLRRYGEANAEMPPPVAGENRVIFFGDQFLEAWGQETGSGGFFPGTRYINRGIDGQTTTQMLLRFRQDVIQLKPRIVVIHGGSNDIAGTGGPAASRGIMIDNLQSMVELAKLNNITVLLGSITPVCDCAGKQNTTLRAPIRVSEVNERLEAFAQEQGIGYINYYQALNRNWQNLTADGLLPNAAGYKEMSAMAEKAIADVLKTAR